MLSNIPGLYSLGTSSNPLLPDVTLPNIPGGKTTPAPAENHSLRWGCSTGSCMLHNGLGEAYGVLGPVPGIEETMPNKPETLPTERMTGLSASGWYKECNDTCHHHKVEWLQN